MNDNLSNALADMGAGLTIKVRDLVTGHCPACWSPRIELVYETGIGGGEGLEVQKYILRCEHQGVCMHRREYMEGVNEHH